jgi:hypothetical protein
MRKRSISRTLLVSGVVAAGALAACSDQLAVENKNAPDVARANSTPLGVEAIVSKLAQQIHQGMYGSTTNLLPGVTVMAFESASQLGNFGMGTRSALPREPIANNRGNSTEAENFRTFDHLSRNARSAADALTSLNKFVEVGTTLGSPARDARARSFGYFNLGHAMGHVALFYDSTAIVKPGIAPGEIPPLSGANDVMAAAIEMLDSALAIAESPAATSGTNGWPIPADWVASPDGPGPSLDEWKRIIRSYRARFRANIGRTPAEHDAANWDAILADATNGITKDFLIGMTSSNGWSNSYWSQSAVSVGWSQASPFIIGMADTTGAYASWLSVPVDQRQPFLIRTPDKRFPAGEDRTAQQAASPGLFPPAGSPLHFKNRPAGDDIPGFPWGTSFYDAIYRYGDYRANSSRGNNPIITKAEVDLLAAEAMIRKGQIAGAAALIDKYRVPNGLPALSGVVTTATQAVPGGNACVPRVPQAPGFTTLACGNIMEAMKWEKRMETMLNGYAVWYLDSRGWGDLAVDTPLDYPVPYQEMDARGLPFYNSQRGAAAGTYGF